MIFEAFYCDRLGDRWQEGPSLPQENTCFLSNAVFWGPQFSVSNFLPIYQFGRTFWVPVLAIQSSTSEMPSLHIRFSLAMENLTGSLHIRRYKPVKSDVFFFPSDSSVYWLPKWTVFWTIYLYSQEGCFIVQLHSHCKLYFRFSPLELIQQLISSPGVSITWKTLNKSRLFKWRIWIADSSNPLCSFAVKNFP